MGQKDKPYIKGLKRAEREELKRQGFFDGRFRKRVQPNRKTYTRKKKHKEDFNNS